MKHPKRKLVAALVIFVILIGASVALFISSGPEPVYQGRTLSEWLSDYRDDAPTPSDTDDAIRHIGTNAVPYLMRNLFAKDSELKDTLGVISQKQHVIKVKYTPPERRVIEAREAFRALGPIASNAVPELIQVYQRNYSIGSRLCALEILAGIGPSARSAVPTLVDALNDNDANVRTAATNTLKAIDPEAATKARIK